MESENINDENEIKKDDFMTVTERRTQLQKKYGDHITICVEHHKKGYTEFSLYTDYKVQFTITVDGCICGSKNIHQLLDLYEVYKEKSKDDSECINEEILARVKSLKDKVEKFKVKRKSWLDILFNL